MNSALQPLRNCASAGLAALLVLGLMGNASAQDSLEVECVLQTLDRVKLPAERAGIIDICSLRVGNLVSKGANVATLKDTKAKLERDRIAAELRSLKIKSSDNAKIDRFLAMIDEKQLELKQLDRFSERFDLPKLERARVVSALRQAKADAESSENGLSQAWADYEAKQAEFALAELTITNSGLTAPFDGMADRLLKRPGEWVQEGEAVVELVRMDKLELVFKILFNQLSPSDALGSSFKVQIIDSQGRAVHEAMLQVERVQAQTDVTGIYFAFAQMDNVKSKTRMGDEHWLLIPGLAGKAKLVSESAPSNAGQR